MFRSIRKLTIGKRDIGCMILAAFLLVFALLDWWFLPYEGILHRGIDSPYYTSMDEAGNIYVINAGKSELLKISKEGKITARMSYATHEEDTFGEANEVAVDAQGNIYVSDVQWNDTGLGIAMERILRFDPKGHFKDVVYEADYSECLVTKKHLFSLRRMGEGVVFATVDPLSPVIEVFEIEATDAKAGSLSSFAWEDAENAQYISVESKDKIYVVSKKGNIYALTGQEQRKAYETGAYNYLLPYQMTIAADGTPYVTDICNQSVYALAEETVGEETQIVKTKMMLAYDAKALEELTGFDMNEAVLQTINAVEASGETMLCITTNVGFAVISVSDGVCRTYETIPYAAGLQCLLILRYVAGAVSLVVFAYYLLVLFLYLLKTGVIQKNKASIILIGGVMFSGLFVMTSMLNKFRDNYIDSQINGICTVTQIASNIIDKEAFAAVQYPADFQSENYEILQDNMDQLIDMSSEYSGNMYCNLVKMVGERCYAFAYLDDSIGAYYPLDEKERSEVRQVYETKKIFINDGKADATGSYVYAKSPVIGTDGEVIGVVEIGMVSDTLTGIVDQMRMEIMVHILLVLVIGVFFLNEAYAFTSDLKHWKNRRNMVGKDIFPIPFLRILTFFCALAYNMPTSFLPVYVGSFYKESLPFSEELAASLPLTVNFAMIGIMAVFCTGLLRKLGFRFAMFLGGICCVIGDSCMALSMNWWMAAGGLLLNGIGCGLVMNGLSIIVANQENEQDQTDGFAIINGTMLSGMICGTVVGATLAEDLGEGHMFFVSGGLWLALGILILIVGRHFKMAAQMEKRETTKKKEGKNAGRTQTGKKVNPLFSMQILGFLLLVVIPYVIVNGFTSYFLPVFGDSYGLTESQTSLFLVMNCLVGIFMSGALTDVCMKHLGKASIYLSSALSLGAVLVFGYFQNLYMLAFALFMLGAAKSFGATTRELVFCAQPKVDEMGDDKAMGYYNFADNMGESLGTVVFGAISRIGFISGMWILTGASAVMLAVFAGSEGRNKK